MKSSTGILFFAPALLLLAFAAFAAPETTVIYDGKVSKVRETLPDQPDLWLTLPALTQVSGFVIKPQGACLDELCVPIPKAREEAFWRRAPGPSWFNLSELARVLRQPAVHDATHAVWLFGARPEVRTQYLKTLEAPNFTLPDWKGRPRTLADLRGKKVLLITWASW